MNLRSYLFFAILITLTVAFLVPSSGLFNDARPGGSEAGNASLRDEGDGSISPSPDWNTDSTEKFPTEKRYVVEFPWSSPPSWKREGNVSLQDSGAAGYEVTRYPDAELTSEHLEAAWQLYNRSYESALQRGLFNLTRAKRIGYRQYGLTHYMNKEYYLNDRNLEPREPEGVVYMGDDGGDRILVGYVYFVDSLEAEGEQFAGPLSLWHYHPTPENQRRCFVSMLAVDDGFGDTSCSENDKKMYRSPEMIHVWFVKHPKGPFSMGGTGILRNAEVSDGVPEKMSKGEFKRYAKDRYEENYAPS